MINYNLSGQDCGCLGVLQLVGFLPSLLTSQLNYKTSYEISVFLTFYFFYFGSARDDLDPHEYCTAPPPAPEANF